VKLIRSLLLISAALCTGASVAMSNAQYARKEGKACSFCHPPAKFKELTDAGKYYKAHNHSLEGYQAPAEGEKR
jgi:hypothetical protein